MCCKYQSPVNIVTSTVVRVDMPPLKYRGLFDVSKFTKMKNNGKTVRVEVYGSGNLSGGPLNLESTYRFKEMHFHWGKNDDEGSEHTINGHRFPLEAHFIFCDCQGICQETEHEIVAVGLFFEVKHGTFVPFYNLFTYLSMISNPKGEIQIDGNMLSDFSNVFKSYDYFTYTGSLTTSPFTGPVTWILYKEVVPISSQQLMYFRGVMSLNGGAITTNWRSIQELNDRIIKEASEQENNVDGTGSIPSNSVTVNSE